MSGISSLKNKIIILPEAKMDYTPREVQKFIKLWEQGYPMAEIAEKLWVAVYEAALLLMHCELEGWIQPRDGGLKGTRARTKRSRKKGEEQ